MEKLLLILFLFVFTVINAEAKIWRVCNLIGVKADFNTAQAAHDAASVGDTIHIEPSSTNYGLLTTNKKLVWIGIGYFLSDNPGNQFYTTPGELNEIDVMAGSEYSVFTGIRAITGFSISCPKITVTRSFAGFIGIGGDSIVLMQNFVQNSIYIYVGKDALITNNLIMNGGVGMQTDATTAVITNNVLNVHGGGGDVIFNSIFQNNIVVGPAASYTFNNSVASYNFHSSNGLPAGNNNQNNVDMSSVFVNSAGNVDKDFILKPGGPAIGAGYGGIDLGAFSGNNSFRLALQPAVPAVLKINAPSSSVNHIIQVIFSAKSNN